MLTQQHQPSYSCLFVDTLLYRGLLFVREEVASFWDHKLTYMIFVGCLVASVTSSLFNSAFIAWVPSVAHLSNHLHTCPLNTTNSRRNFPFHIANKLNSRQGRFGYFEEESTILFPVNQYIEMHILAMVLPRFILKMTVCFPNQYFNS